MIGGVDLFDVYSCSRDRCLSTTGLCCAKIQSEHINTFFESVSTWECDYTSMAS